MASSRLMIWARMETSRAETGSSQTTSSGSRIKALAMATRKGVRIAGPHQRRIEADGGQNVVDAAIALRLVGDAGDQQRFGDDVIDTAARIEGGDRVLEDDLQATAQLPQRRAAELGEIDAVEQHPSRRHRNELEDGA